MFIGHFGAILLFFCTNEAGGSMARSAALLNQDYVSNKYYSVEAKGPLLDKVYSLRYQSYRVKNFIDENRSGLFMDKYDEQGNSSSFLTYNGGKLIGSLRCSRYEPKVGLSVPVMEIFHDEIEKYVGYGTKFIEVNRLVVHPSLHNKNSIRIRFNIFKNVVEEVDRLGAECVVIGVRPEHVRFYQSIFSNRIPCQTKKYPLTNFDVVLLACFDIKAARDLILRLCHK